MDKESRFIVIPKASIRPNKIVFYNQFVPKHKLTPSPAAIPVVAPVFNNNCQIDMFAPPVREWSVPSSCRQGNDVQITSVMPQSNQHSFELSKKASGRIKEKISWLYELAKMKTVVPEVGKPLYSFKMNFITLTLPSLQAHTTSEITSRCLNQFLTELKAKFGLSNYVWRLEFQGNGNAHYHIATDTYVSYVDAKSIWNRCLYKLGYVAAYSRKMCAMSFQDYRNAYGQNGKIPFETLRRRYYQGVQENWLYPNTVDVRAVGSARNIAFYVSKYITKMSDTALNPIVSAREPASTNLRLWFCSKSLSALDKIEIFMDAFDDLTGKCLSALSSVRKMLYDYCVVWYFNGKEQIAECRRDLWQLYRRYAYERGYIPAG